MTKQEELRGRISDILYNYLEAITEENGCCSYIYGRLEATDMLLDLFYEWRDS